MNSHDIALLRRYVLERSEAAFAELVRQHIALVYSAALRQTNGDAPLAQDATQVVFTDLARKAARLTRHTSLAGWLYTSTRYAAATLRRAEQRRSAREQEAHAMNQLLQPAGADPAWEQLRPVLDEAMHDLKADDREAVLLRYFEHLPLAAVGARLGVTENTARMRVDRALDKLRGALAKRGVTSTAGALAVVLTAQAASAVPVGLAASISATAVASAGTASALAVLLARFLISTKLKLLAGATVLVGTVTFWALVSQHRADHGAASAPGQTATADPAQNQQAVAPADQAAGTGDEQQNPDPLKLLQGVARARQRIDSGSMELLLSTDRLRNGRKETTQSRMAILFDGTKLRCESRDREYAYIPLGNDDSAEAKESIRQADSMDEEAAVRAGLLKGFAAHEITAFDGATLVRYREDEDEQPSATVYDPAKGSANSTGYFFDPRCLGLGPWLSFSSTVERCLGYSEAKSIHLVGQESVEGLAAWHIQVQSKQGGALDFWIDVAQPTHLVKQSWQDYSVVSKYADANPGDPIPTEVTTKDSNRNGALVFSTHFVRSNAQFNVSIVPTVFTLAGLGMAIGTPVGDLRIQRLIGYWTGAGLSESPPNKRTAPQTAPKLAELLDRLDYGAASPEALQAAAWILLNTPDGPAVDKAADVILREHTGNTNLAYLCTELGRLRHRCSRPILEAMLKNNPSVEVRATACFTLAKLLKDEAKYGQNQKATAQAEKQFERVISEFGRVKLGGSPLADIARPELNELRHLTIGNVAPEIEGEDLEGHPMKLSSYRGKVVVLTFWWLDYTEAPVHRKLVERLAGKPFAFIGVYGEDDLDRGKAEVEKYGITWPSFRDGHVGPISRNWNVRSWPNVWVLDRKGVIRYREVRGGELDKAVDTLLRE